MSISLQGYDTNYLTFQTDETLAPGTLLGMTNSYKVGAATDGVSPIGVAVAQRDDQVVVQMSGLFTFPYTADPPALGRYWLTTNPKGGVKVDEMGREVTVVDLNTMAKTVTFLL